MRRLISFQVSGDALVASLDEAPGTAGLLIVSGGNEVRHGAHRGMAMLARALAADGMSVFRYDRRGVGDSDGVNRGWRSSRDDLVGAVACFRQAQPQLTRVIGFGNCDAASTLAISGQEAGIDRVLLANPWVVEEDALPPAAAIRARYADRLRSPAEWRRLLTGGVDLAKLARGLAKLARPAPATLADEVVGAIARWGDAASIVLARGDNTAIAFADAARRRHLSTGTHVIDTGSHSFARAADQAALAGWIAAAFTPPPRPDR